MPNKIIIRKATVAGEFTTIHHSILYDVRLTPMAFRTLTSILADADNFNITQELIKNRFNVHIETVRNAFKNLEECGYMRRKLLPRGFHYTISEFGNLAPAVAEEAAEVGTAELQLLIAESNKELSAFIFDLKDYIENESFNVKFFEEMTKVTDSNLMTDVPALKAAIKPILKKVQKKLYKEALKVTENIDRYCPRVKTEKIFKDWLKSKIYDERDLSFNAANKWLRIQTQTRNFVTDAETAAGDYAENNYYD